MVTMVVLMIISLAFYFKFIPDQIRVVANSKTSFTSQTFPKAMMAALFVVALIGFCKDFYTYMKLRKENGLEKREKTSISVKVLWDKLLPATVFIVVLVYAVLFKYLGYIISTVLFVPAFLGLLKCKKWGYYAGAYGFAALMYLVFTFILRVPLP